MTNPQQHVPGIAVGHIGSRFEIQGLLRRQSDQFQIGVVMSEIEELPVRRGELRNPGLVIEHQPQGDLPPTRRNFGQVFRQRIVQIQLVFVGKHHHGDGGELLPDGADLEHRLGLDRHIVLQRGDSITPDIEGPAVLHDGEGDSGMCCRRISDRRYRSMDAPPRRPQAPGSRRHSRPAIKQLQAHRCGTLVTIPGCKKRKHYATTAQALPAFSRRREG